MHPAKFSLAQLQEQCNVRRQRRRGPGGQHRNKVETAIVVTHRDSNVQAEGSERRTQAENLRMALKRLRINLAIQIRMPIAANPSELWQKRCRNGRLTISKDHDDFPALLAECLDTLANHDWDLKQASEFLSCSSSQIVKFLKLEPRSLMLLNEKRVQIGLSRLK